MHIFYLGHSGFAVETPRYLLVFDDAGAHGEGCGLRFCLDSLEATQEKTVLFFSSHSHGDHFSPDIFFWRNRFSRVRYILSDDIRTRQDVVRIAAGQTLTCEGVIVRALCSTDLGVAFLVTADGYTLYHAGDLNWWHWEGEPKAENEDMARRYKAQVDTLAGKEIDVAFLPVDPRLEQASLLGIDYFMRVADAHLAIPMHFWGELSVFEALAHDPRTRPYRAKIATLTRRSQMLCYERTADSSPVCPSSAAPSSLLP